MIFAARPSRSIPTDKMTPLGRVPLLVRSKGAEIGIRTKAIPDLARWRLFVLDFDSELLFVGDVGTTGRADPADASAWNGSTSTSRFRD
jgi:hypothetical protein